MDGWILGIDPDLKNCSAALINPQGRTFIFFQRAKANDLETPLAHTAIAIDYVVNAIAEMQLRSGEFHVFIEDQSMAHAERQNKIRKQDLITLAQVSGAWAQAVVSLLGISPSRVKLVKANTWKQQQSKWINQTRTLRDLGMPFEKRGGRDPYPVPTCDLGDLLTMSPGMPNPGDFKDINDSLGIALYGFRKVNKLRKG